MPINGDFADPRRLALLAAPGTWGHLVSVAPPWISVWSRLGPEMLGGSGAG